MSDPIAKRGSQVLSRAGSFLDRLPPEAILNVIDVVGDFVKLSGQLKREDQAFVYELKRLQEDNASVEKRLGFLKDSLVNVELSEELQARLVDTICTLALR